MTIAITEPVAEKLDSDNTQDYSLGSFTPAANSLLVVIAGVTENTTTHVPTMTDSGMSLVWTRQDGMNNGATERIDVFTAQVGASPVPTIITVHYGGSSDPRGIYLQAFQVTGHNTSTPVRQTGTHALSPITFGSAMLTNNGYMVGVFTPGTVTAPWFTQPTSWTEVADGSFGTPTSGAAGAFRAGGETGTTVSWTGSAQDIAVAIEINVAPPTVTSVTPNSGSTAGGTSITDLAGTGFISGATVTFGGSSATNVTFVSATKLTCTTPAHAAGAVNVVVTNPDTQTGTGTNAFTYVAPPTVSSCTPNEGSANGGQSITNLAGTGFLAGATVTFGGTSATNVSVVNSTKITCTTPAHSAGAVTIRVTNTDTQYGELAVGYTYVAPPGQASNPTPTDALTGVDINQNLSWSAGSGATSHDVYFGTDSTPDAGEFIGNQAGTSYDPGTLLQNTTYYWRIDEKNAYDTTTGIVWSFTTLEVPAKATTPVPTDASIDRPINQDISWTAGARTVSHDVYFGTDPTPDAGEFQGNQVGTSFDTGTLLNNTVYYWRIDEVNGSGTTTGDVWSFTTIHEAPVVTSVTPNQGYIEGGESLTIDGSGFYGTPDVSFGKNPYNSASNIIVQDINTITCDAPVSALPGDGLGLADIVVLNDDSQSDTLIDGYEYISHPATGNVSRKRLLGILG